MKLPYHMLHHFNTMAGQQIRNYISPGLISVLIDKGRVRFFENTRPQEQFITPHSHRFNFAAQVLRGSVTNHIYVPGGVSAVQSINGKPLGYSPSNLVYEGEAGKYSKRELGYKQSFIRRSTTYNEGQWYYMDHKAIHSIEFSEDAVVMLFEGPNISDTTTILEPFVDGQVCRTFEVQPWMFSKPTPNDDHMR